MRILTILLATVALFAVSVAALAAMGDGTVDACYHNRTGDLRIDVDGDGCRSSESSISVGQGLITRRVTASATAPAVGVEGATAFCDVGEVIIGGGYETATIHPDVRPFTNAPLEIDGLEAWQVTIINESPVDIEFASFALCAPGTSSW